MTGRLIIAELTQKSMNRACELTEGKNSIGSCLSYEG